MYHADGAANISDLVRYRSHQNPRSGEKLLQAGLLAFAQMLGSINGHCRKPRSGRRAVRGKEHVSQENLAIIPLAASLHLRAEDLRGLVA